MKRRGFVIIAIALLVCLPLAGCGKKKTPPLAPPGALTGPGAAGAPATPGTPGAPTAAPTSNVAPAEQPPGAPGAPAAAAPPGAPGAPGAKTPAEAPPGKPGKPGKPAGGGPAEPTPKAAPAADPEAAKKALEDGIKANNDCKLDAALNRWRGGLAADPSNNDLREHISAVEGERRRNADSESKIRQEQAQQEKVWAEILKDLTPAQAEGQRSGTSGMGNAGLGSQGMVPGGR